MDSANLGHLDTWYSWVNPVLDYFSPIWNMFDRNMKKAILALTRQSKFFFVMKHWEKEIYNNAVGKNRGLQLLSFETLLL